MIFVVLAAVLFMQAPRGLQPGTGIVTGSVRVADGGSAAGVRVAAVPVDDPASLISVGETDAAGRYRLTNIPEGRYYIVAGRVANPTYYPGGTDKAKAAEIVVEPARVRSSVDFSVPADSRRPPPVLYPSERVAVTSEYSIYRQILLEPSPAKKLKDLQNYEQRFPKSQFLPDVYTALMEIHMASGVAGQAESYGNKALKIDPNHVVALVQQSRLNATIIGDLGKSLEYAQRAVAAAARLKAQPNRQPFFDDQSWRAWVVSLESSAKANLEWVKQKVAWQREVILSNLTRRR